MRNSIPPNYRHARSAPAFLIAALLLAAAPLPELGRSEAASPNPETGEAVRAGADRPVTAVVDCELPAKLDRLGSQLTKLGAPEIVEISPEDCASRGGNVVGERARADPGAARTSE